MIKRWYNALSLKKHEESFQRLFASLDGFALSRQARIAHDAMEYTYGEIDFISFIGLLSLTHPTTDTVFYDLGSGTGKAVFATAMVFNVHKSCGIELFHTLHEAAIKQQQQLQQCLDYQDTAGSIHFINADFLHVDFSDATLIFINATALFGDTWIALNQRLNQTKSGTMIITTSKKLLSDHFAVKKITPVQMSWGRVNAYVQQRIATY